MKFDGNYNIFFSIQIKIFSTYCIPILFRIRIFHHGQLWLLQLCKILLLHNHQGNQNMILCHRNHRKLDQSVVPVNAILFDVFTKGIKN